MKVIGGSGVIFESEAYFKVLNTADWKFCQVGLMEKWKKMKNQRSKTIILLDIIENYNLA